MIKNILSAISYFLLSTVITWWFIEKGKTLYFSQTLMLLSCAIAGAKWGLQIVLAIIFLKTKKWIFIKKIGQVCFVGSLILLPYCFFENIRTNDKSFLLSLIFAVFVMVIMYYREVKLLEISKKWFYVWLSSLAMAVALQIFLIFKF